MHIFNKILLCGLLATGITFFVAAKQTQLTLAKDGKTSYILLLRQKPIPTEKKAAEELHTHLKKITGADFKIVREGKVISAPYISIGKTAAAKQTQPPNWNDVTAPEGCGIAVKNGNLYLFGGKKRGPLYATYMFLEEDLGCRWYGGGRELIPSCPDLTLKIKSRISAPTFSVLRDPQTFYSNNKEFTIRNRGNGVFSGIPDDLGGFFKPAFYNGKWWFSHTYNNILRGTTANLKKYPDCFMMDKNGKRVIGQLCPMNPQVQKMAVAIIIDAMRHNPGEINLSQNDTTARCHCPLCEAVIAREETTAAPHLTLVNYVANAVKKAGLVRRKIVFLGYQQTRKPPKYMKMAGNTALWLCSDIQSQAKYIPVDKNAEFVANLKQWRKVVPTIYIWDYYVNFNNYFAYEPTLYAMAQNFRFYANNGIKGVMAQGAIQTPGAALEDISAWVFEKLLWNPKQNIKPLLRDYINGVYGPAAPPMEKLYLRIYDMGKKGHAGPKKTVEFDRFEKNCLNEASALLKKHKREDLLPRLELASMPLTVRSINRMSIEYVKQGKPYPEEFKRLIADFEKLARRHKVTNYSEPTKLNKWIERIRKRDGMKLAPWKKSVEYKNEPVEVNKLSSLWKFKAFTLLTTAEEIKQESDRCVVDSLNDSSWDDYIDNMGVGWEAQGYAGFIGTGVFRNSFEVRNMNQFQHYYLFFGSVDCESGIYINGRKVYEHTLKRTGKTIYNLWNHPFGVDIKKYLRKGRNSVAVACTNHGPAGGIYMPVFLVGSNQKLNRIELYKLTGSRHPYALDGNDEIANELKK